MTKILIYRMSTLVSWIEADFVGVAWRLGPRSKSVVISVNERIGRMVRA
jgi:hypothetical protein